MQELTGGFENCEAKELSKADLIEFLQFLKGFDGKPYEQYEDETTDYTIEIKFIEEVIKKHDNEEWVYYYWAWW
ncbi:hypothetical protein LCGC14_0622820 [marine sediment metagenome]|uniref:Uncharacterized protein n=1 Tax=marine sediment metagenome TaxID=412755 RepID=A0A0F9TQT7_9ZZZZ